MQYAYFGTDLTQSKGCWYAQEVGANPVLNSEGNASKGGLILFITLKTHLFYEYDCFPCMFVCVAHAFIDPAKVKRGY